MKNNVWQARKKLEATKEFAAWKESLKRPSTEKLWRKMQATKEWIAYDEACIRTESKDFISAADYQKEAIPLKSALWTVYNHARRDNKDEPIVRLALYTRVKRKWRLVKSRELSGKDAAALLETLEIYLQGK